VAHFRTLDDVDLRGKRVLLRVDLNVPMADGEVGDPTRIERMAPTVAEIAAKGGKVILLSHFGRPKGRNAEDSLRPVAAALARHLGRDIAFADDCRAAPCLHRFGFAVSRIDVSQRLPVGVTDDIAAGHLVGVPRCGEAASPRCMLAKGPQFRWGRHSSPTARSFEHSVSAAWRLSAATRTRVQIGAAPTLRLVRTMTG
jgi:Phosphoglycerate kinase